MKTATKVILSVAAAAAAGAMIGMLLAPEKGKDLQAKIRDGAKDWLAEFTSLLSMGKEMAAEARSQGEEALAGLTKGTKALSEKV
ncbi:MAG TPA: YtxH domain-containing protein [Chryseolinea sp.]